MEHGANMYSNNDIADTPGHRKAKAQGSSAALCLICVSSCHRDGRGLYSYLLHLSAGFQATMLHHKGTRTVICNTTRKGLLGWRYQGFYPWRYIRLYTPRILPPFIMMHASERVVSSVGL